VDSEGDVSGSRAGAARCCEGGGGWLGRPCRTKNNQTRKERINPRRVLEILTFTFKNLDFSLDNLIFSLKNVKISWYNSPRLISVLSVNSKISKTFSKIVKIPKTVSGSRAGAARCCEEGGGCLGRPRRTKNNQTPKERINPRRVFQILTFALKNLDFSLDNLIFSSKNVKKSWDNSPRLISTLSVNSKTSKTFSKIVKIPKTVSVLYFDGVVVVQQEAESVPSRL
jgi:hypothetical protein